MRDGGKVLQREDIWPNRVPLAKPVQVALVHALGGDPHCLTLESPGSRGATRPTMAGAGLETQTHTCSVANDTLTCLCMNTTLHITDV